MKTAEPTLEEILGEIAARDAKRHLETYGREACQRYLDRMDARDRERRMDPNSPHG